MARQELHQMRVAFGVVGLKGQLVKAQEVMYNVNVGMEHGTSSVSGDGEVPARATATKATMSAKVHPDAHRLALATISSSLVEVERKMLVGGYVRNSHLSRTCSK